MKVWLVFRERIVSTEVESVWATEEDAQRQAEELEHTYGFDTLVEPYDVQQFDGEACGNGS